MYILRTHKVKHKPVIAQTALTLVRTRTSVFESATMPKSTTPNGAAGFGRRLAELRKAAGFTQQELADEAGVSRRMIAYYEGQTDHPPTTLLPALAHALKLSTDALLGLAPVTAAKKPRGVRQADSRLVRRLQAIEKLEPAQKRQVLQVLDAFIERGQLKRKMESRTS